LSTAHPGSMAQISLNTPLTVIKILHELEVFSICPATAGCITSSW